jgi:DNA polymerase-1
MNRRPAVWIFDAHFQIFRSYHSLPDLRAPDDTPIGAVRGYAQTLIKFLREREPTHVAAAYDHALTSFRNTLYPDYKLGRTEAPEDLEPQFELCAELTAALGIPLFGLESFEADDVIATLVRTLTADGADVSIISRDKDLTALVSERVDLFDLATERRSGPAEVKERMGVSPEQVTDFLSLVGDAVDNIPGVSGIGAATASRLLAAFGSAERIPSEPEAIAAAGLRGAQRIARALAEGRDALALSRALVSLRDDLPLRASLADLEYRGADRARLEGLFARLGLESMLRRVPRFRA